MSVYFVRTMDGSLHPPNSDASHAPAPSARPAPFEEHLTSAFASLRASLHSLLTTLDVDTATSPEVARRLNLSRNLTWKVSKVLASQDLHEGLQHLPGDAAIDLLLNAAAQRGVPEPAIRSVRESCRELERVVKVHVGDRATLDLYLDGMAAGASERLEQSRKLAFRGNSGVWGLQAKARITAAFVAPSSSHADLLDTAIVGGIVGLRRLRPVVRWPLFRSHRYRSDGSPEANQPEGEAIDPSFDSPDLPRLIGEFCSTRTPPIRAVRDSRGLMYELMEGRVGNTGAFTCFFGSVYRAHAPRFATEEDKTGEFGSHVMLPFEHLLFDLFVHRDLPFADTVDVRTVWHFDGAPPRDETMLAPIGEPARELSGRPPLVATPIVERYDRLIATVFERAGWAQGDFRALRLSIAYPPMNSTAIMRFTLPERP